MDKWWTSRARRRAAWGAALTTMVLLAGCGGGGGAETAVPATVTPDVLAAQISSKVLETSAQPVLAAATDIDDSGRLTVLFAQATAGRVALHAVQGEPGARDVAPVFNLPTVVDALAPYDGSGRLRLVTSPAGHALALWFTSAPCTATTYNTSGQCSLVVTARRLAGAGWEPPLVVGDTPGDLPKAIINDAGDAVLLWPAWQRDAQGLLTLARSVVWRTAAASQFTAPVVFADIQTPAGSDVGITLSRDGQMVYTSMTTGATGNMVVARRGNTVSGFGQTERLDTAADAVIEGMWGGVNGHVVVLWQQTDGARTTRWSATLDSAGQAWQIGERSAVGTQLAAAVQAGVSDAGDFFWYDLTRCVALRRTAGAWQAESALPAGVCLASPSYVQAVARRGDLFGGLFSLSAPAGNTGQWLAYGATLGELTHPIGSQSGDYLLGTASTLGGSLLLAENGVVAVLTASAYDILPSADAPAGTLGSATNLWVTYLKLP